MICGAALEGALARIYRVFGVTRSARNPNLCTRCGTHVAEGRLEEVTVLFADLSDFTALTGELGATATHELVDAFLRRASACIVDEGGFIDKYVGDAVIALFNVPLRHRDHPARAVDAARAILAETAALGYELDRELEASIGIATGYAHIGRLGSDDAKDFTAIGDVVNLASRLQDRAARGQILISAETSIELHPRTPLSRPEDVLLKGFAQPQQVFAVGTDAPDLNDDESVTGSRRRLGVGAVLVSILGAPCVVGGVVGPVATITGAGSFFGTSLLSFVDAPGFKHPVIVIAMLAAIANLYVVRRGHRAQTDIASQCEIGVTKHERRRTRLVFATSLAAMCVGIVELGLHALVRH